MQGGPMGAWEACGEAGGKGGLVPFVPGALIMLGARPAQSVLWRPGGGRTRTHARAGASLMLVIWGALPGTWRELGAGGRQRA